MITDLHFVHGDLLTYPADYIAQQVNCRGVMGAGLAKQIRTAYPELYAHYSELCTKYTPAQLLGRTFIHKRVLNIFGQLNYGTNRTVVYTDYTALQRAFTAIHQRLPIDKSIAFPHGFGCGLAHGNWDTVLDLIKTSFPGRTVYIVFKTPKYAVVVDYDPIGLYDDREGFDTLVYISTHDTYEEARALVDELNRNLGKECGMSAEYFVQKIVKKLN